ncbi:MAG: hypothetical protein J5994_08770 [Ruminococcus sp.]|nr:hypothetical protein [Ruminococcus sp.]
MERKELDELAFYGKPIPSKAGHEEQTYYLIASGIYRYTKLRQMSGSEKKEFKQKAVAAFDKLLENAKADPLERAFFDVNVRSMQLLEKLTQPRAELVNRSKQELVDIICRFGAALSGMLNDYDEEIPMFFKLRVGQAEQDGEIKA